jgi:hypothetical protein
MLGIRAVAETRARKQSPGQGMAVSENTTENVKVNQRND